jgi:hypothetical protein
MKYYDFLNFLINLDSNIMIKARYETIYLFERSFIKAIHNIHFYELEKCKSEITK